MTDYLTDSQEQEDYAQVASIESRFASDNYTSWRFRTIAKMNPYMASNPQAIMAMASMPISNQDLFTHAGAIYGMQQADSLAKRLPSYQPSVQRAIFSQLTLDQQRGLTELGYKPPTADVHHQGWMDKAFDFALMPIRTTSKGIGGVAKPILGAGLNLMTDIVNVPMTAYRTVRQLDGWEQWVGLAGAVAGSALAIATIPVSGGLSGTLMSMTIAGMGGIAGATATTLAASTLRDGSPARWMNSWNMAWNGERLFTRDSLDNATKLLEDQSVLAVAQEVAVELDNMALLDIAKEVAGTRDAQREEVQIRQLGVLAAKYGEPGTEAYARAFNSLKDLFMQPKFKEAVNELVHGKYSPGRDAVRLFNLLPGIDLDSTEGLGRWISGGIDAASMFFFDPFMFAGGLANKYKLLKYGLNFADVGVANRFREIAQLPKVARKMDLIADAVRTGRTELFDRGAREWRAWFPELRAHMAGLEAIEPGRVFTGNDVVEWIAGSSDMKAIMSGFGIVHGTNYAVVKGIGATQNIFRQATIPVREFLNGIDDVRIESLLKKILDDRELGPKLIDSLTGVSDDLVDQLTPLVGDPDLARAVARELHNKPIQDVLEIGSKHLDYGKLFGRSADEVSSYISRLSTAGDEAYRIGRIVGTIPGVRTPLRGIAQLVKGMSQQTIGGAVYIIGRDSPDTISRFVDLFSGYTPSYVRNAWKNAILTSPNPAIRREAISALVDSVATATGMRLTKEGNELLDEFVYRYKQAHMQGPMSRTVPFFDQSVELPAAARPIEDMAQMVPIPDLKQIRNAVRQQKVLEFLIGQNPHVLAFQTRYWKPSVLLRMGFIFRNAGEELVGFMTRYGFGHLSQEFTARGIAQSKIAGEIAGAREAASNVANLDVRTNLKWGEMDRWVEQARWDLPAVARPLARVVDTARKSSRPYMITLGRYTEWLNDLIARRATDLRARFQAGFGFADGLTKYTAEVEGLEKGLVSTLNMEGAKKNLQNWWRQLAFGNPHSFRRMIIGGVDPALVKHAERFEGQFLKQIMDQVGTSNMAPWERAGTNYVHRMVQTERGEEIAIVQDLGVREFGTRDNPSMLAQPHSAAVWEMRAGLYDDPITAAALNVANRIHNADIASTLPAAQLKNAFTIFDNFLTSTARGAEEGALSIDREVFQLYLVLTNSRFDYEKFQAILANMRRTSTDLLERYAGDTILTQWVAARNELVDVLQASFPVGSRPTWADVTEALNDKNPMLKRAWQKYTETELGSDGVWGTFTQGERFTKARNTANMLSAMDRRLGNNLSAHARDWYNGLLYQHLYTPGWLDREALKAWDTATGYAGSPFYANWTEAEPEIRNAVRTTYQQYATGEQAQLMASNARWTGEAESGQLYVIPAKLVSRTLDDADPLWRVRSLGTFEAGRNPFVGLEPVAGASPDEIFNLQETVRTTLAQNKPLIFTNRESAEEVLRIIAPDIPTWDFVTVNIPEVQIAHVPSRGEKFAARPEVAGGMLADFLGVNRNVFGYQRLNRMTENSQALDDFGMLTYFADDFDDVAAASFHVEPMGRASDDMRLERIVDATVEYIKQNMLAGRRAQWYVRDDAAAKPLFRSIGGKAERVTPGERIVADEVFYSSADLAPDSVVAVGNQMYFLTDTPIYEGNSEILWSVMSPLAQDHYENAMRMSVYGPKGTIERTGRGIPQGDTDFFRYRYGSPDDVKRTNINDLPDYEILKVYKPVVENAWDRVVKFGFNRVIGPWIDAMARKPTAFHAFVLAAERNTANVRWLIQHSPQQSALREVIDDLVAKQVFEGPAGRFVDLYGELGRLVGKAHNDINASEWSSLEAIGYLRGALIDDPELLGTLVNHWTTKGSRYAEETARLSKSLNTSLRAAAQDLVGNTDRLNFALAGTSLDDFMTHIDMVLGPGSAQAGFAKGFDSSVERLRVRDMTPAQQQLNAALFENTLLKDGRSVKRWDALRAAATQRATVEDEVYKYAAEHAIRDLMPFIDTHEIRSQFADMATGLLPFWYAEENFLKRWAKMFSEGGPLETLARVRKLQRTYLGLRTMGIIRTDPQGRQFFVWPGSDMMNEVLLRVFGAELPINTVFQSPVEEIIPGFKPAFGAPGTGPFVAVPLDLVASVFPEAAPLERAVLGDFSISRSVVNHIVPAQVKNTWDAIANFSNSNPNASSERLAGAMMTAMQQLEFTPYALPDNATAGQKDEYLRRVRDYARVILLSQALGGWYMPAQVRPLTTPGENSLSWLTDGAIDNPAEIFSKEYYQLINDLGIEEGTIAFVELNADANIKNILKPLAATVSRTETPSGAPLPTTEDGIEFFLNNQDLLSQYPDAGPWLLPQDAAKDSKRSQYAYDTEMITGLRERRTPEEFLDAMKFKEGSWVYFDSLARYETAVAQLRLAGNTAQAQALDLVWDQWATTWKLTHPIFAEQLVSSDARQRRQRIIDQMRYLIKDPNAPRASHFESLVTLQQTFDNFMIARGQLALDKTANGEARLRIAKQMFADWVLKFVTENPMVGPYWQTVLSPEAGVD